MKIVNIYIYYLFYFIVDKLNLLLYNTIKDEMNYEKEEIYHDKRNSKNLNENITPFWEYYMPHAREVSEQRNEDEALIIKFVDRYNKQFIPIKFQFKEIKDGYVWSHEIDSIELKVAILNVTELVVTLKCEHNGNSKELEITESPYMDIYQTVYHFLAEAVLKAEAQEEEEANMEI